MSGSTSHITASGGLISAAFFENVCEPGSRQRGWQGQRLRPSPGTRRAELDGLYAPLYGLTRDELAYILDTFPIVCRKEEEKYGEYRTKQMILENFDGLAGRYG